MSHFFSFYTSVKIPYFFLVFDSLTESGVLLETHLYPSSRNRVCRALYIVEDLS